MKNILFASIGVLGLLTLAGSASAQQKEFQAVQQQQFAPLAPFDTRTISPQIATTFRKRKQISENEFTKPWTMSGALNSLRAGASDSTLENTAKPKITFPGTGFTGYFPPDCDVSVSNNWVVSTVNTTIAFYNKRTGTKTFEQDMGVFFQSEIQGELISDPKVFFDVASRRWFTLIIEVGGIFDSTKTKESKQLVAVSDDEDPNGTWTRYRIDSSLGADTNLLWLDYPGFGASSDTVVITGNMFPFSAGGYGGNIFIVMSKASLLNGTTVTTTKFQDPQASTTKVAISSDTREGTVYTIGDYDGANLKMHAIRGGAGSSPRLTSTLLRVPNYANPAVPVPGPSGHDMDRFDARIYNANYRNGRVVAAHGINVPGGDSRQLVRWYEILTNSWPDAGKTPAVRQTGNIFGGAGEHLHMPAININQKNDISVVFSRSSSSTQADLVYAAHRASDPAGVVGRPQLIAKSAGLYGGTGENRWGDYFGLAIDPVDQKTFWGYGQVSRADGGWATFVASWLVPSSGENARAYNASSANIWSGQGTLTGGNAGSLWNVDRNTYNVTSKAVKSVGQVAAVEATFTTPLTGSTTEFMRGNTLLTAPAGSSVQLFFYNYATSKYDLLQTTQASTTAIRVDLSSPAPLNYIKANGEVKILARIVNPIRGGATPPTFVARFDQLQVLLEGKVN